MVTSSLQPDQQPDLWSEHADAYEAVFEPLTDRFAQAAVAALGLAPGQRCLDVAAGAGGAALMAAREGATVLAIDAAPGMVDRIRLRAMRSGLPVEAASMDAQALALDDGSFDAALSIFGIILCPDPVRALKEAARLVRPGGKIAIVTWTEPQNYELITRLLAAIAAVRGPQPSLPGTPAQLRFSDDAAFRTLFGSASLEVDGITRIEAALEAPSALWLSERLDFAPGIAALLAAQGEDRAAVLARFVTDLERDQGQGPVALRAIAFLGVACAPPVNSATRP
ncbi:class I SAM-dependent methyltransferase [Methylorubrum populi]|jgi:2-polyprenyl-3-methyl-5-hydroxy-6-metoxy-1,4-benzoquinol methylase|uniref:2-polyprenyl-3-methyl-5-hydroxy-6-metoxy-1, 4-benzoquinol methylase n=1 Tax=Methylobacterium brachiatum TaxID=269660 RepID=A0AAJ1TME6_9HYPH|nr:MULTISPECIES: class I SAM-dependent methyltransferase [Methylobacterium]MCB4802786.1 class I SAM-dependent methyltransferase [Methylobacterium brachiatum]MDQ0543421.1 2-polyprenyl-3-methyl-5-hydroxy-6-metoxy-1,4-benzoquinol methylase [Methylobacterium brachiatum]